MSIDERLRRVLAQLALDCPVPLEALGAAPTPGSPVAAAPAQYRPPAAAGSFNLLNAPGRA